MLMRGLGVLTIFFGLCEASFANCPPGQRQVKAHHRSAYTKADGRFVKATNVKAHCRDVSERYKTWIEHLTTVTKIEKWPHKNEVFTSWSEDEKERVMEALEAVPSFLLKKPANIHRAQKSASALNPATSAEGIIVLYDTAFDKSKNLARILSHEFAHQHYMQMSDEEKQDYWYSNGWIPIDRANERFISRKSGYVADDGRNSPEEDFANNLEFYVFDRKKLNSISPDIEAWIEKEFGAKIKNDKEKK